jgi:hypothetical protein
MTAPRGHAAQVNFTPSIIATEEFTDNLFLDADNEEEAWITRVGVGLSTDVLWQTAGLNLTYQPSYVWYQDFSEYDNWRHEADLSYYHDLTRFTRLTIQDSYLQTTNPSDESEAVIVDDPLERPVIDTDRNRRGRDKYYTNVARGRLEHRFGERDRVYLGHSYRILREEDVRLGQEEDDYDIHEPSAGVEYWPTPQWGVGLDGRYAVKEYKDRDDRDEINGRLRLSHRFTRHLDGYIQYLHTIVDYDSSSFESDFDVYAPSAGIRYQFEKNAHIDVSFGHYWQNYDNSDEDDEDGYFIDSAILKVWPFRLGEISVSAVSGYEVDDEGAEDRGLKIYYGGRLRGRYDFTRLFYGTAYAGYSWADYPNDDPSRTDEAIAAGAGLRYQVLRWMNLNLDYDFIDRTSDDEDEEYTENRVAFTITIAPETPFRIFR